MLLQEWARLRKQLETQNNDVLERLIKAYGEGYGQIEKEIKALTEFLSSESENGSVSRKTVKQSAAYNNLISAVQSELDDYEGYLKTELRTASNDAAKLGLSSENYILLVAIAGATGVAVADVPRSVVSRAPEGTLDYLNDYLDRLSPRIDQLSNYHSAQIAQGVLDRVAKGWNPNRTAKWITDAYGMGLTDSARMMRTAQLYSYRQANNAVQMANSDILDGVVWCAKLDTRTCMSCIVLNGKTFPVGTVCNDHHNGRCVMLPLVKGANSPITESGIDWFTKQGEGYQRSMMGVGKFDAWKAGKFTLDQLSTTHDDAIFGEMRVVASLDSLLGEDE